MQPWLQPSSGENLNVFGVGSVACERGVEFEEKEAGKIRDKSFRKRKEKPRQLPHYRPLEASSMTSSEGP
jgi:hypothetical protein